jgi:hypothetical protein
VDTSLAAELQHQAHALRALARLLVGDAHADDLVQDVAVQALQGPPPTEARGRGWLQVVLRRRASCGAASGGGAGARTRSRAAATGRLRRRLRPPSTPRCCGA